MDLSPALNSFILFLRYSTHLRTCIFPAESRTSRLDHAAPRIRKTRRRTRTRTRETPRQIRVPKHRHVRRNLHHGGQTRRDTGGDLQKPNSVAARPDRPPYETPVHARLRLPRFHGFLRAPRRPPHRRRRLHARRIRPHRRPAGRRHRPPERPRHQGKPQAQLRQRPPRRLPQGHAPDEDRREIRPARHHHDRHPRRLPRHRCRRAQHRRSHRLQPPRNDAAQGSHHRRRHRRGRLRRRARHRRRRPRHHDGKRLLLRHQPGRLRRHPLEAPQARPRGRRSHEARRPGPHEARPHRRRHRRTHRRRPPRPPGLRGRLPRQDPFPHRGTFETFHRAAPQRALRQVPQLRRVGREITVFQNQTNMAIKVGVIGAGGMLQYHAAGFRPAGAEIVAVADPAPGAAAQGRREMGHRPRVRIRRCHAHRVQGTRRRQHHRS